MTAFIFTVSLDKAIDHDVTVRVNTADAGTHAATAGSDYTALVNELVTITAGTTSKTVTVSMNKDNTVEYDETFDVTLSAPKFNGATDANKVILDSAKTTAVGTITNDDTAK